MKNFLGLLLVMILSTAVKAQSKQGGSLTYSSEYAEPGKLLTLNYKCDSAFLSSDDSIYGIVYIYDTAYNWRTASLNLIATDSGFISNLQIPEDASVLAFKFFKGNLKDNNNDRGYIKVIVDHHHVFVPGAEAGYGLLRSPSYGLGVPDYFDNYNISDTATYMWLSNEILRHNAHGAPRILILPYVKAIYNFKKERSAPEIKRAYDYLLKIKPLAEENLYKAWYITNNYTSDTLTRDSIAKIELEEFPNGLLAKKLAYKTFTKATKLNDVLREAENFVKRFPYSDKDYQDNKLLNINYYNVFRGLTLILIAQKKNDSALNYIPNAPFEILLDLYYKMVTIPYDDWKTYTAAQAYKYSKPLFDRLQYFYHHKPSNYWYLTDTQWKNKVDQFTLSSYELHARILKELGKDQESLKLATYVQKMYHYKSTDLNQTMVDLYKRLGFTQKLHDLLINSVRENEITASMIQDLKNDYLRKHSNDLGFDDYFESLKDKHSVELLEQAVANSAINIEAPSFTAANQNGDSVSIKSLNGKVVILDFWATWCAPCKAAMAGMNMAVKKFKNDKNVVFYFVDTQERIPDYKQKALAFLKLKGYNFNVLFDKEGKVYEKYAAAIHTSGIPFKVILNPQGNICNSAVGYKGSPNELNDEINAMINLAKKSK